MLVRTYKYDDLGNGICKIDNKVCFIKRALPNEYLDIKLVKDKKKYSYGVINKVLTKNENRITAICKYYDKCGGCNFLHINNIEEKIFKKNKCINYFGKLDGFLETKRFNYRNKITLHVRNGLIGLYNQESHDIVKINYCYLIHDKMNDVINLFQDNFDNNFNGKILIRINNQEEILVAIDGNYKYIKDIVSNNLIDNLIYNETILKGKDYFIEAIDNFQFMVHYQSFFQVNRDGLKHIINILRDVLKTKNINKTLDLYSGTSVLGIIISKYVKEVISVEMNSFATNDALKNLELNKVNNLKVINSKVEDVIDTFHDIDLIIVDPARKGLDSKTIEYLKNIKSKYLIYIACGIDSLKRDLNKLNNLYLIDKLYVVDMFPCTIHVETVVVLEKTK